MLLDRDRCPWIENYLQYVKKGIGQGLGIGIKTLAEKMFEKYNVFIGEFRSGKGRRAVW
jgi:hypothetical protein